MAVEFLLQLLKEKSRTLILLFSISISTVAFQSCSTNPATGERHVNLISESQEIQMGKEADQQIVAQMGLVDNPQLQKYVENLGRQMASKSERPNLPWTFRVVDDPVVNAFALPGGYIYITRGILSHFNNEAELAGVLGHEIGHVTAKHSVYRISSAQLAQLGLGVAMILKPELAQYQELANLGLGLLFLKFSRDDERQADELGVRYMQYVNKDPRELKSVMETLDRVSQAGGGGGIPEWLSTHPNPGNRIALIDQHIDTLSSPLGTEVNRDTYMNQIDGMVFGQDPREGYFVGNTFFHPQLRFKYVFPQGWQLINQKQAVIGISQQQDMIIQITLSDKNNPNQAANDFFSQQGISKGNVQSSNINGLPAVSGNFSASTEQGDVAGVAVFINYGNYVYQILSYSGAQQWNSYQSTAASSINSFSQLNDPDRINVEPQKINIVTLNESMSLQQFAQRYPSTVDINTLARINQVEVNSTLNAGLKVKQVTGKGVPEN